MATNVRMEKALAELAYSIAYADGQLEDAEMDVFEEMIGAIAGESANQVRNTFLQLGERSSPNVDYVYRNAMFAIRKNKEVFNARYRSRFVALLQKLAAASQGERKLEKQLFNRFLEDIDHL